MKPMIAKLPSLRVATKSPKPVLMAIPHAMTNIPSSSNNTNTILFPSLQNLNNNNNNPNSNANTNETNMLSPTSNGGQINSNRKRFGTLLPYVNRPSSFVNGRRQSVPVAQLINSAVCRYAQSSGSDKHTHEIKIKIKSNYGHKSLISCSKIDVIGTSKVPIEVKKVRIVPDVQSNFDITKLISGTLIKDKPEDAWSMNWPPNPPLKCVDIVIDITSEQEITALRVWPVSGDETQNIREVSVSLDKRVFYDGELPKDFGQIISFSLFDESGKSIEPFLKHERETSESDRWGVLPFKASTKIEIYFLSAYLSDKSFGLQHIMFFDRDGQYFDVRENSLISVADCGEEVKFPAKNLFWAPNEKAKIASQRQLWTAELTGKSRIVVAFQEPTLISAIAMITLKPVPGPIDVAAKQVRIVADGRATIWCGKLRQGNNSKWGDERECTTAIFLYDNLTVRRNVLEFLNLLPEQQILQ